MLLRFVDDVAGAVIAIARQANRSDIDQEFALASQLATSYAGKVELPIGLPDAGLMRVPAKSDRLFLREEMPLPGNGIASAALLAVVTR